MSYFSMAVEKVGGKNKTYVQQLKGCTNLKILKHF